MENSPKGDTNNHQETTHVVLVPMPIQGHVTPFMKLAHKLSSFGVKVTFFISEHLHQTLQKTTTNTLDSLSIVSVPDGLPPEDDEKDNACLTKSIFSSVMPAHLGELIKRNNEQGKDDRITCVIADASFGWAVQVAQQMGVKSAMFFASAPGALATILRIPKLVESGIIDSTNGKIKRKVKIQLSPSLPDLTDSDFLWNYPQSEHMKSSTFHHLCVTNHFLKAPNWVLCNWFSELDPSSDNLLPNLLTIGPLLANGESTGNLLPEDPSCLTWLDKQAPKSVIYVAFGTSLKLTRQQFDELALGLELSGQPFLWVVHPTLIEGVNIGYRSGLEGKMGSLGNIVEWAPQERVLAHQSISCFLTQCGWNSTMESISNGVPMLCWPYYTDQFYNRTCICYGWKVGLELCKHDDGIFTRFELKKKIYDLLNDDGIRANAIKLMELARDSLRKGGLSCKKFEQFVAQLKV